MRVIKEPGVFRKLMSGMGGRTFIVVVGFSLIAMLAATALVFREEFGPEHWLSALRVCAALTAGWIAKRVVEEVGEAFGTNGKE